MEKGKDNLYLIKMHNNNGDCIIKLGYSGDIKKRLRQYEYHNPFFEVIKTYYSPKAKQIEKEIHSSISSCFLNEWYSEEKLNEILSKLKELKAVESNNIYVGCNEGDITYVGNGINNKLLDILTPVEYMFLAKLSLNISKKTNIITCLSGEINCKQLGEMFKINRNHALKYINTFESIGAIKKCNENYVMNPNFYHKSRTLGAEIWGLFGLEVPSVKRY